MPNDNPFSLAGKTALIAGASRGIGLAIGEAMARAGARVILAARSTAALSDAAAKLHAEGFEAEPLELDIASRKSREQALAQLPDVDILANVAGINQRKPFTDYTREEYDRIMETNLHGLFEFTQGVGRAMIARGKGGKVVMIGSLTGGIGLPYVSVYTTTKAALNGLTRSLAVEWGQYGIQVNCIAPGFILTDLSRALWQSEVMQQWLKTVQPTPRMGTVEDIASVAVFLSSRASDYITGQVISVDGGCSTCEIWPFRP